MVSFSGEIGVLWIGTSFGRFTKRYAEYDNSQHPGHCRSGQEILLKTNTDDNLEQDVEQIRNRISSLKSEIQKVIVGYDQIITQLITSLIAGGHVLLEGVPGLGKTLMVRTLARVMDVEFKRVQFTPDLMPADILGTEVFVDSDDGSSSFRFREGPIFGNIILADEINRATPKTQSALLEAMQEQAVTIGDTTHKLEDPFFVVATQNPIEMEGTYPLPEAQTDRFFFKLNLNRPDTDATVEILERTTGAEEPQAEHTVDAQDLIEAQELSRKVPTPPEILHYVSRLVDATHPDGENAPSSVSRYIRHGASPRGAQSLVLSGKIAALADGRFNVAFEDVRKMAKPSLRHRLILNFEGEAEDVVTDELIEDVLETVPEMTKESEELLEKME